MPQIHRRRFWTKLPLRRIAFEDDAVQVPAAVIAYGFDLETSRVQSLMRSGELTSHCEKGENEDVGRYRLTFFYKNRRFQLVINSTGIMLQRSVIDFGDKSRSGKIMLDCRAFSA